MKNTDITELGSFQGDIGQYKIVRTDDDSLTLHSEKFDESCHSMAGAYQETLHNYVMGCNVLEISSKRACTILEVGFGLGVGLKVTLESLRKISTSNKITYISVELDCALIKWAKDNLEIHGYERDFLKDLQEKNENGLHFFELHKENIQIIILIGNARDTLPKAISKKLIEKVDCIYQDAFSPKKNPILWTVEWFTLLRSISTTDTIMTTYSSAKPIKKSMVEASWIVNECKGFASKKTMTKATITGSTSKELLGQLERSPRPALRDKNID